MNKKLHHYKLALLTLLTLPGTALTAAAAADYDFVYDNVYFKITSTTAKTCKVVQRPDKYSGSWVIAGNPLCNGMSYTCTAIGDSAFINCTGLTSIQLPNTVTSIGECSFQKCTSLKNITLPTSLTKIDWSAFCFSGLTSITIPNSVTSMSYYAFQECTDLSSVTWGTGMKYIPRSTFEGCTALTSIKIPHWVTSINLKAFYRTGLTAAILPYGLKTIDSEAFGYSGVKMVLIPSSVTSMSSDALNGCSKLSTVYCNMATPAAATLTKVPSTCKIYVPVGKVKQYKGASGWSDHSSYIEAGAFDYCYGSNGYDETSKYHMTITSTTPVTYNGETYDGTAKYVYHPCIKDITNYSLRCDLYETDNMCGGGKRYLMTELGDSCFAYMASSVETVSIAGCAKMTKIGAYAFDHCKVTSMDLPAGLTSIGKYAFWHCEKLPSIVIPNTVVSMGTDVLNNCSVLTSVTWGTGMKSIPSYTFYYCKQLATFNFPYWITSIGLGAFENSGLQEAILPYGLTSISSNAFRYSSIKTLLIPSSVTSMQSSAFVNCQSLKEVYCNMAKPVGIDVTGLPSVVKFFVPVDKVKDYRATSGWSNYLATVNAGAFDFDFGSGYSDNSKYHMTVTSTTPVTYDGETYAGTAKYVYHPNIKTISGFSPTLFETDNMCGSGKKYLMTEVGDSCFYEMSSNTTSLNFSSCAKMTKVGDYAFAYAKGLKDIVLPGNLTSVGQYAFCECDKLPSVTFPNTVTSMGTDVFNNCDILSSVRWSTGMKIIPSYTFYKCPALVDFKIPHWITDINRGAFYDCALKQAILPYGIKKIDGIAFMKAKVTTVLVPSSLSSLAGDAFDECTSLTKLYYNFSYAKQMNFTNVPATCKVYVPVGSEGSFKASTYWKKFNIEAGAYDFNYGSNGYDADANYHMTVLSTTPVTVDGVTYDGTAKYVYHPNIKKMSYDTFGGDLFEVDNMCGAGKQYVIVELGDSCLYSSSPSVESIDLSSCSRLTKIGHDAMWMSNAKRVYLPASLKTYGDWALYHMISLTDLYVENPTPATIKSNVFQSADQARATLHVPTQKAVNDYKKASVWKDFYKIETDAAIVTGDVNGDGEVNIGDINAIISVILGGAPIPGADVNGDGEVNIGDVNTVIDIILS